MNLGDVLTLDEHAAILAALAREEELLRRPSLGMDLRAHYPVFGNRVSREIEAEYIASARAKLATASTT